MYKSCPWGLGYNAANYYRFAMTELRKCRLIQFRTREIRTTVWGRSWILYYERRFRSLWIHWSCLSWSGLFAIRINNLECFCAKKFCIERLKICFVWAWATRKRVECTVKVFKTRRIRWLKRLRQYCSWVQRRLEFSVKMSCSKRIWLPTWKISRSMKCWSCRSASFVIS